MTLLVAVRTEESFLLGSDIAGTVVEPPDSSVVQPYPIMVTNHNKWRSTGKPSVMWAFSGHTHVAQPLVDWADKAKFQSWTQLRHDVQTQYQRASRLAKKSVTDAGGNPADPVLAFGAIFVGYIEKVPGMFMMFAPGLAITPNMGEVPNDEPMAFGGGSSLALASWAVMRMFHPEEKIESAEKLGKFIDAVCEATAGIDGPADLWRVHAGGSERVDRA